MALMRRIDELHLDFPLAGSWMLQGLLKAEGLVTGRLHVATLMKKTGIASGQRVYPYLLRKLAVTRPNQVWAMDLTYNPDGAGLCLSLRSR